MKAIIIDDAAQARRLLRLMLKDISSGIDILAEAENAAVALEKISISKPDLLFLDIEMPGRSGLQLLEDLSAQNLEIETIFITAYNQYAIQAFHLSAVDYLLKPFRKAELQAAIEKAKKRVELRQQAAQYSALLNNLKSDSQQTLSIPLQYGSEYLPVNDIEYIEADGAYSVFHLVGGRKIVVSKNLKHYEDTLCGLPQFAKLNRSFIANIRFVKALLSADRGTVLLQSGKSIKLSPGHKESFLQKVGEQNL